MYSYAKCSASSEAISQKAGSWKSKLNSISVLFYFPVGRKLKVRKILEAMNISHGSVVLILNNVLVWESFPKDEWGFS